MRRSAVGVLLATMLTTITACSAPLGIMVPAYFYPTSGGYWNSLDFAASRVPLIAIMNPNSGPGASQDSAYVRALANLHQAGGKVTAYVHTSYGTRPLTDVESDIDLYLSFYAVDGFFIDEMTDDESTTNLNYYATIYQYIKAKNANYSVTGNPGSNTQSDYITRPTADSLMIFENDGINYSGFDPSSWVAQYPAQQFVHLPYDVATATTMSNDVGLAVSRNAGWIYITDDSLPNPYDTLPSYWTNEVNLVQSFNGGVLPVTIITQPADQTAKVGSSTTFSVAAFGSQPLSYQWFTGTNAIVNATNASYTISPVQLTNVGDYYVQVTNSINSTNSRAASLTINSNTNASTYKHITIDGSFTDWTGVPLAYTAPMGSSNAIQYQNVYIANDQTNLYIRFTLYSPRTNAFANSYDNIFIDTDDNASTGYPVGGIGSEMLVQWGNGYQEKNGGFNEGGINKLGWAIAGSTDNMDFELAISRSATYASNNSPVFTNNTIAILLEGDDSSFNNVEFAPPSSGLVYTFATAIPGPLSISASGGNVIVSWPSSGTLQSCGSLTNDVTWSDVPDASNPYNITPTNTQQFFRLIQ
ncbi:MAG TPA: spherulation-specific family 4 protein [Verrucomicrobiae bacterium]|nr:spherulation-specific family 4 protein [Verrucomicrobiae bacterium]